MRTTLAALAALALIAAPASAQRIGARTAPPEQTLAAMGEGNSDAALEQAIAAAGAHPLGTLENPVRVAGPEGERAYLARLRCANGAAPRVGVRSAAGVGAYGSVVGSYALDCGRGAPTSLVMDMYHEENRETRAPAGFTLAP